MVQVPDKEHAGEQNERVEFQGSFAVDSEFFQIKEFFQPGEEPFDTDPFCIFVREPFRGVWFDSGFYLSDRTRIKCLISDEEPGGEPGIICLDLPVKVVELLGVMDVGCGDGKSGWKFCFRVDIHMDFIPVHIFFFDMVPAHAASGSSRLAGMIEPLGRWWRC